jgi:membrane protease YdiL (CAAX protease family)
MVLLSQLLLVLPGVVYIAIYRINIKEALRFKKISFSNVMLLIVFAFLIMPLMAFINAVSMLFATNFISDTMTDIIQNNNLLLSLFVIAFIPCLFEESIYRGLFFNEYRKQNTLKAILLSALLFGLLHMNINQFSYAFILGIVFAFVVEATDSIVSTIIIHFVINGSSVVLNYMLPRFIKLVNDVGGTDYAKALDTSATVSKEAILASLGYLFLRAVVFTGLAFLVYRMMAKNTGRWESIRNLFNKQKAVVEEQKESIWSIPLVIGVTACIVLMIANEILIRVQ